MTEIVIEFEDGRLLQTQSQVAYRELIQRINSHQIIYDGEGSPIDLTSIKSIKEA